MTFVQKIKRIDYTGNTILISSTVSTLISLTYGGTRWSWSSPRTLISIFGLLGLLLLIAFSSAIIQKPNISHRLHSHIAQFRALILGNILPPHLFPSRSLRFSIEIGCPTSPHRSDRHPRCDCFRFATC